MHREGVNVAKMLEEPQRRMMLRKEIDRKLNDGKGEGAGGVAGMRVQGGEGFRVHDWLVCQGFAMQPHLMLRQEID